jgi:hypothetical protein
MHKLEANTSIFISEVIQFGRNLSEMEIIKVCNDMASFFGLKSKERNTNVKAIAYESDFERSVKTFTKLIKMAKTEHIDNFFKDGSIQLGSFKYYHQFDNPEIGDKTEGAFIIVGCNNKSTTFAVLAGGFNNYMFCTYNGEPDPQVIKNFEYNDYFEIIDIDGFQNAISQTLDSVGFLRSECQYRQMKAFVGKADESFNLNRLSGDLINLVNHSKYFVKTSDFHHQKEFRFLWTVPYDIDDRIIIKCPEARQFCKRK